MDSHCGGYVALSRWIDLNADLGEGCGDDAGIMQIVSSCNIACGGHAGDEGSMRAALMLSKENSVSAGAHPSYPDRDNFGRKDLEIDPDALRASLVNQITAIKDIADDIGVSLAHIKPHGALYNFAAKNAGMAHLIAEVTETALPGAALVGPPSSELQKAADARGTRFLGEAFADRAYEGDGSLRARSKPGAVITNEVDCAAQVMQILLEKTVTAYDGSRIPMPAKTICLHSDTPGALTTAKFIRDALKSNEIEVRADD